MKIATIFLSIISASATIGSSGSAFAYDDWIGKKADIKIKMRSMGFGLSQIEAVESVGISIDFCRSKMYRPCFHRVTVRWKSHLHSDGDAADRVSVSSRSSSGCTTCVF
jgi:hypothetical protein